MPTENMRIQSTILGFYGHASVLSIGLVLERGGERQPYSERVGSDLYVMLRRLLLIGECNDWSQMKGKWVRVERDEAGNLARIGHIANEDWLDLRDFLHD